MSIIRNAVIFSLILLSIFNASACKAAIKDSCQIGMETAKSGEVTIQIKDGDLILTGGAEKLLNADYSYNKEKYKPEVNYFVKNDIGYLTVIQDKSALIKLFDNKWNFALNNDLPLDLSLSLGAGVNNLNLGQLNLRNLEVSLGAGRSKIDFRGLKEDLNAEIKCGVGGVELYLPQDVGVRVIVSKETGKVENKGLNQNGSIYTNSAYESSDVTINIHLVLDVSHVKLSVE